MRFLIGCRDVWLANRIYKLYAGDFVFKTIFKLSVLKCLSLVSIFKKSENFAIFFLVLLSGGSHADIVLSTASNAKLISGSASLLYTISEPNRFGVSINEFDEFELDNRSLKVVNVPSNPSLPNSGVADLIIFVADDFSLMSQVELVGLPADIVFLSSKQDAQIKCIDCSFRSFPRVSLIAAAGKPIEYINPALGPSAPNADYSSSQNGNLSTVRSISNPEYLKLDSSSESEGNVLNSFFTAPSKEEIEKLGVVSSSSNGNVQIDGLDAGGVYLLELFAAHMSIDGTVNTKVDVSTNSNGQYVIDPTGNKKLGLGSVELYLGGFDWDYDSRRITGVFRQTSDEIELVSLDDGFRFLNPDYLQGDLESVSVKAHLAKPVVFNGSIDTVVDVLSTTQYKKMLRVNQEGVIIQAYLESDAYLQTQGLYFKDTNISSEGVVSIKSNEKIGLGFNSEIESPKLEIISLKDIDTGAKIRSDVVEMSANTIRNNGEVHASEGFVALVDWTFHNQYGGKILAKDVQIQSLNGYVQNGSRYPYESRETVKLDQTAQQVAIAPFKTIDLGFYGRLYNQDMSSKEKAENTSAEIIAQNISIKAPALENINPYWKKVESEQDLELDRIASNQVVISAEQSLDIELSEYLLNTSAIIRVNSEDSKTRIKADKVVNERYRSTFLLDDFGSDMSELITRAYTYSPPGVIALFGKLELEAYTGFLNDAAYVEIFGDAEFKTPRINDFGVENEGFKGEGGATVYLKNHPFVISGWPGAEDYVGASTSIRGINPHELDSLFYIHGNKIGKTDVFTSTNHRPINVALDLAKANVYSRMQHNPLFSSSYGIGKVLDSGAHYIFDEVSYTWKHVVKGATPVVDLENGVITIETYEVIEKYGTVNIPTDPSGPGVEEVSGTRRTHTFSLWEEIKAVYLDMKSLIEEVLNEIDWWE